MRKQEDLRKAVEQMRKSRLCIGHRGRNSTVSRVDVITDGAHWKSFDGEVACKMLPNEQMRIPHFAFP